MRKATVRRFPLLAALLLVALAAYPALCRARSVVRENVLIYTDDVDPLTLAALRALHPDVKEQPVNAGDQISVRSFILELPGDRRLSIAVCRKGTYSGLPPVLRERSQRLITSRNRQTAESLFQRVANGFRVSIVAFPGFDDETRKFVRGVAALCEGIMIDWLPGSAGEPPLPSFYDHTGRLLFGPTGPEIVHPWEARDRPELIPTKSPSPASGMSAASSPWLLAVGAGAGGFLLGFALAALVFRRLRARAPARP